MKCPVLLFHFVILSRIKREVARTTSFTCFECHLSVRHLNGKSLLSYLFRCLWHSWHILTFLVRKGNAFCRGVLLLEISTSLWNSCCEYRLHFIKKERVTLTLSWNVPGGLFFCWLWCPLSSSMLWSDLLHLWISVQFYILKITPSCCKWTLSVWQRAL